MRKLETTETREKKQQRNKAIFSYIVLGILLISSLGYAFISSDKTANNASNNQTNGEYGGRYYVTLNGRQISFENSPESVKNISVDSYVNTNSYAGKTLYLASEDTSVNYEIASTLGIYSDRVQTACYGSCDKNLPEKSCNDSLIIFNSSTVTNKIYQESGCVFIEGDMETVDAFLYKTLGVQ